MPSLFSHGFFVGYVISVPIVYVLLGLTGVDRKDLHMSFIRALAALLASFMWPLILPLGVIAFLIAFLFSRFGI